MVAPPTIWCFFYTLSSAPDNDFLLALTHVSQLFVLLLHDPPIGQWKAMFSISLYGEPEWNDKV